AAVMNYLLKGKTNREIANILSISDKTISTYKRRLLNKFNVENIVDLAKLVSL
ncbi:response regulator transcription factor, partial [Vibrio vulnificus]